MQTGLLAGCSSGLESVASVWVRAAAAEGFSRGEGSCAHFPADSPLLLPQMLFVRQHRGNPHGAAHQGFSPTRGRHKLFSHTASGLAAATERRGRFASQQRKEYVNRKETSSPMTRHPRSWSLQRNSGREEATFSYFQLFGVFGN